MKKRILFSLLSVPAMLLAVYLPSALSEQEAEAAYAPYQVVNGGFETGNLTGWKVFQLGPSGEVYYPSFDSSLIHGENYFTSNPYHKDGNYNLGITSHANQSSGPIVWVDGNHSDKTMGYLRSSDFILGGSGWISYKLGGGRWPSFCYMSIMRTSDDTEVARFANRHWNNTSKASTQYGSSISNAEAFMFQYYFDLSSVTSLGTQLYILLSDTSADEWSVLSADSFVTYIASAPTPSADQTATNILPTISGIDTASNSIVNGYFDTNLSGWSLSPDASNGWYYSSNHYAKSNSGTYGGDAAIGIIRSSAFTVTTNKYIRFDWAGGLKNQTRIFVSIREVGTNIEKLRFVRRDNLSSKESENFDNHMLNLTSLSDSKKYYIEFTDNISSGWGISYVDSIRFVPESEWNSVTSGDRAVSISDLPLTFTVNYVQEAATYGAYFIDQTASYCAASNGGEVPWSTLTTEYSGLSNDAKNYFVNLSTTETNVVAARDRFVHLWNKYHVTHETWTYFLVDASNNPYTPASANPNSEPIELTTTNLYLVGVAGFIFLCGIGGYFLTRRRHA